MEEQFVYCGSPHYELHGKPMNNIKFLSNKKLTCKFFNIYIFFYICSIFDRKVFDVDVAEAQYCIWLMADLEIYIWRDQTKFYLFIIIIIIILFCIQGRNQDLELGGAGLLLAICGSFDLWLYYYLATWGIFFFFFGVCDFDVYINYIHSMHNSLK